MLVAVAARAVGGEQLRLHRAAAVTEQNLALMRSGGGYWWLLLSGFAEPVFYLLAIGWGVGDLVGDVAVGGGRTVPYLTYVGPALLAAAAMNGSIIESGVNFFVKITGMRFYDAVLNTPVTPVDIAFGELAWAMVRGGLYSGAFLAMMAGMGLIGPWSALATVPAALLVGFAFGGVGLVIATIMRVFEDYDYISIVQTALFLFSGTFVPVADYPRAAQVLVELTPLYHAVELVRGIALDQIGWSLLGNAAYLLALMVGSLVLASRRLMRKFRV
ncbi:ABC transporter permease [Actinomadura syzygii]|uniref:Transport permease protein n=1 Tax=Actinomadura syzygii TaxID=1427538 RepID=A0A5D0TVR1_9ACTN|nr:ABC transporter permease [Actinomadura syzygii]TYC10351.1 ABC transporter [Actinomadura syzygii]